jgi:cytochrome c
MASKFGFIGYALLSIALVQPAVAAEGVGKGMADLARARGCMLCHELEPARAAAEQTLPAAPSFREIAQRYRGDKSAEERLTQTVLQGTGGRPGDRHWIGKASSDQMLPNAAEITPEEVRSLVTWILSLAKRR